jgi:imidazolonepropionase-like amidohydrolase
MRGIAASFVVIGDAVTPPIAGGALVLDDSGRIVAVGPRAEHERAHPSVSLETHRAVLMPGLINAHVHIELSAMRGQVKGGRGFTPWVTEMMAARERMTKYTAAHVNAAAGTWLMYAPDRPIMNGESATSSVAARASAAFANNSFAISALKNAATANSAGPTSATPRIARPAASNTRKPGGYCEAQPAFAAIVC